MIDGAVYEYVSSKKYCRYKKQSLKTLVLGASGGGETMINLIGISKIDNITIDPPMNKAVQQKGKCWFDQREISGEEDPDQAPVGAV